MGLSRQEYWSLCPNQMTYTAEIDFLPGLDAGSLRSKLLQGYFF